MPETSLRSYYDSKYHYGEDLDRPNDSRLWHSMRHLAPMKGARFLDVGCGVGLAGGVAERYGGVAEAVGLDFSWSAISSARQRGPGRKWVQGDGTSLPFADASFDVAFSFGSMEHFPDVPRGFSELRRVMKDGGRAVIVVPNFWVRTDQPQELRATEREWRRIIEASGFEVLKVGSDRGPALLKNRRPLRVLMRLVVRLMTYVPPLRYQHVFVLRTRG